MKKKLIGKSIVLGMSVCLLSGCGNTIPELTDEQASLVATFAADVLLSHSDADDSRLIDTEQEALRREEIEQKAAEIRKQMDAEAAQEEKQDQSRQGASAKSGGGYAANEAGPEAIAPFIGLDGFTVDYAGYEISPSYEESGSGGWNPTIDAADGMNLLILKFNVSNSSGTSAVLDVLSQNMTFRVSGIDESGNEISGGAGMTMLLNDFANAQDEMQAGESREYVLMIEIGNTVTEVNHLSLFMKKGEETMTVQMG